MCSDSPVVNDFSSQLDRMEKLLIAAGISSPVNAPSALPAPHLDVADCYKQLNFSTDKRPEDIAMRQALELYCSLMSPPSTPTSSLASGYQSEPDKPPVTLSPGLHHEREIHHSTMAYSPAHYPSKEHHQPFAHNFQEGFYHQHARNDYTSSTLSSISDHEASDSDDMDDDPFASYPLSYPLRLPSHSHSGLNSQVNSAHHRKSSSITSQGALKYVHGARPMTPGASSGMTKAATIDAQYPGHQAGSKPAHFDLNVQPTTETKPAIRKRAFSVITFGKHRKTLSGSSAALRISGPIPLNNAAPSSSTSTFSASNANTRSAGRRLSLLGCLSPAMEENEDITPFKMPAPPLLARSSTSSELGNYQFMNISNKFSSRSESKSIWKTLTS